MNFDDYQNDVRATNETGRSQQPLLGLVGEIGSVFSLFKKRQLHRGADFPTFKDQLREELGDTLWYLTNLAEREGLSLKEIAESNIQKARAFHDEGTDQKFDLGYPEDERFPRKFEVVFSERKLERSVLVKLRINGVFVGDALTDNAYDDDGYRFHDVFHLGFVASMGWSPEVFVTNAVLCNPKDDAGNNATPNRTEVSNCSGFLKRQIDLVSPRIVVALGSIALAALNEVEFHGMKLATDVRTSRPWYGRLLIPLYHPGQRALVHRSYANQLADWQFLSETAQRLNKRKREEHSLMEVHSLKIADLITAAKPTLTYFALHKLYYLVEYLAVRELGSRLSKGFVIRQKDGPYCVELHHTKLADSELGVRMQSKGSKLYVVRSNQESLLQSRLGEHFSSEMMSIVQSAMEKYGSFSDSELKRATYLTGPMRYILRRERGGANMFNAPIDFSVGS